MTIGALWRLKVWVKNPTNRKDKSLKTNGPMESTLTFLGVRRPKCHVMKYASLMLCYRTLMLKLCLLRWRLFDAWWKFHFLKLLVEVPNFWRRVLLVVWQLVLAERSKSKSVLAVTFWLQLWLGQLTHAVAKSREALEKLGADNWSLGATWHRRLAVLIRSRQRSLGRPVYLFIL